MSTSMRADNQAKVNAVWPRASGTKLDNQGPGRFSGLRMPHISQKVMVLAVCGLVVFIGLAFLGSHFHRQSLEAAPTNVNAMVPLGGLARSEDVETTPSQAPNTTEPEAAGLPTQLLRIGTRYRVSAETAYFFDVPRPLTPNGRYLQRGDEFYGEGERNGFVRTSFALPTGEKSSGWLKIEELTRLPDKPASLLPPADAAAQQALARKAAQNRAANRTNKRLRTSTSASRQKEGGTRVGRWLRSARDLVLPRKQRAGISQRKQKKAACNCPDK
jgi:hypothetical protein